MIGEVSGIRVGNNRKRKFTASQLIRWDYSTLHSVERAKPQYLRLLYANCTSVCIIKGTVSMRSHKSSQEWQSASLDRKTDTKWKRKCSDCKSELYKTKGNIHSFVRVNLIFTHIIVGYTYLLRAWALLVSSAAFFICGDFRETLLFFLYI